MTPLTAPVRPLKRLAYQLFTCALLSVCAAPGAEMSADAKPKARAQKPARRIVSPSSRLRARAAQARQKKEDESTQAGGGKVIEFKQLSVEGTVQRPSASYFLQRRKLKFRGIEPKKSFIPEILSSVKRPPF